MLKITILGNGGGLNAGLPYNAFLINEHIMAEAPPDIMLSLNSSRHDVSRVDSIFISHLHGDHTFGLPFFILNKWVVSLQSSETCSLAIWGPDGIEEYAKTLLMQAFTADHPCYPWCEQHVAFHMITPQSQITWDGLTVSCFAVQHLVPTYGFLIENHAAALLAYTADTVWCPQVENVLAHAPHAVLADMNGGSSNVHMSVQDILEKALPITGTRTTYYGVHLFEEFESPHPSVLCAKQGDEILIA